MRINHNISALNTYNALSKNTDATSKSMEKLSSGLRINRAADDAAGLAISEKMRNQINGLEQAQRNSQDGISLIQTAEGGLNETQSMLQRMSELTVQAANETLTTSDTSKIQSEITQLTNQIGDIASQTKFNTKNILNTTSDITFQVGANGGETITMSLVDATSSALGLIDTASASGLTDLGQVTSNFNAVASANLAIIQSAINVISEDRANLGAVQNRLEHTINNLQTSDENLTAAESRIRDVDMAKEMMTMTKNNILSQAAQSMLAQANQQPQGVLQLLR
ncbi:flagellin [Neobacillus terrae]|uniref:flagellin N-terminal helical domain-containing protein n=1 Tax=Neobacillus terrae TaxID=3034837 RepID=UPI00140DB5DB|nr:flagellin [Neobacillus terrae]NHM29962.1 flagellin [Neobacillus terrae]